MRQQKWALLSVYDKTGVADFACRLITLHFKILSTGNTAAFLKDAGIAVTDVSNYTGFPEIMDGRVKTLHPKIHAGILARRNQKSDLKSLEELGAGLIDLVAVTLYPFESKPGIEMIDVGGPTMLRAAAKNFEQVTVVCDPADYDEALSVIARPQAEAIQLAFRKKMAGKVFALTAKYDGAIANYFGSVGQKLRYGENPHQAATWRLDQGDEPLWDPPLQGKELSYNNILDADAAWGLIREFQKSKIKNQNFCCAIIKHTNPCGVALSKKSAVEAFEKAYACDPTSAFGGIVAFNCEVDEETAGALAKIFLEVVLAPGFSKKALEIFSAKKNLRVIKSRRTKYPSEIVCSAGGGVLVQETDTKSEEESAWQVKTKRKPSPAEIEALSFAWKVAKHVKSNAIVFAGESQTLGIGAGQTSRIDSVKIAAIKMDERRAAISGLRVVASDAFFPFPDNIEAIAKTGATAVIQPGGSIKDPEVIAAADKHNLSMLFTGTRHFKH